MAGRLFSFGRQGKGRRTWDVLSTVKLMKRYSGAAAMRIAKWVALSIMCIGVVSCSTGEGGKRQTTRSKEYFPESKYGKASPRVAHGDAIPRGGGRYIVGEPYKVAGRTFVPRENPAYDKVGKASWYGSAFHGRQTANGEVYDTKYLSAAHPTLPLPSYARVTNIENGSSVVVRINDRGPFHADRIIDLSQKTAELLDMAHSGTAKVRVQYLAQAPLEGNDAPFLMASFVRKGDRFPQVNPGGTGLGSGVMLASAGRAVPAAPTGGSLPALRPDPASTRISLAGPTPSAPYPVTGPSQRAPAQPLLAADDPFSQFVILPEFGPLPLERPLDGPGMMRMRGGFASAYVQSVSADGGAFEAILVRDDQLTPESILAYARRTGVQETGR